MQIYLYTHSQLEARNAASAKKASRKRSESQSCKMFYTCQVCVGRVYAMLIHLARFVV